MPRLRRSLGGCSTVRSNPIIKSPVAEGEGLTLPFILIIAGEIVKQID